MLYLVGSHNEFVPAELFKVLVYGPAFHVLCVGTANEEFARSASLWILRVREGVCLDPPREMRTVPNYCTVRGDQKPKLRYERFEPEAITPKLH